VKSLPLLLAVLAVPALQAQPRPRLVADLSSGTAGYDPFAIPAQFSGFSSAGSHVLFVSRRLESAECGLWTSEGTAPSTVLLADLCAELPGGEATVLPEPVAGDGRIAYYRDDHTRLWRSDGTPGGTFLLNPQTTTPGFPQLLLTPDGRTLFFEGCTPGDGCELWRSDGTPKGTRVLASFQPGAKGGSPRGFAFGAGKVFFVANDADDRPAIFEIGADGRGLRRRTRLSRLDPPTALYASDTRLLYFDFERGAPSGSRIHSLPLRAKSGEEDRAAESSLPLRLGTKFHPPSYFGFTTLADRLYFIVSDSDDLVDLWESDGTERGTRAIHSSDRGGPYQLTIAGGRLLFLTTPRAGECALLSYTPGDAAPHTLATIGKDCLYDTAPEPFAFGGRLYWVAGTFGEALSLWSAGLFGEDPHPVLDLCQGGCGSRIPALRAAAGNLLVADTQAKLWRLDGAGEAIPLASLGPDWPYSALALDFAVIGGRIVFQGFDPEHLLQPWVSDFTPEGTRIAALLGGFAAGSNPRAFVAVNGRLVFSACGPQGIGLYAHSGEGGAGGEGVPELLAPPFPGCDSASFYDPLRVGRVAYVQSFAYPQSTLWRSDGTPDGTFPLGPPGLGLLRQLASVGGKLVFTRDESDPAGIGTIAFWSSDGTQEGTKRLFHLLLGGTPYPLDGPEGVLLFIAQDSEPPFAPSLFASDGTEAGTHLLLHVQSSFLIPRLSAVRLDGKLYVLADPIGTEGNVLLVSDGTPEGTHPVDPATGPRGPAHPSQLTAFAGALYFFADAEEGGSVRRALYRSAGTPGSVQRVALLAPPSNQWGELSAQPTVRQGRLYLVADDGVHGAELWTTDGTAAGTALVRDVHPGPLSSNISGLTAASGRLFFSADDGVAGRELWTSDGTPSGTRLVQDLAPGVRSSSPDPLARAGNRLYFGADDGKWGRELWLLPLGEEDERTRP
jgi:ELWxxDGT repeat protein